MQHMVHLDLLIKAWMWLHLQLLRRVVLTSVVNDRTLVLLAMVRRMLVMCLMDQYTQMDDEQVTECKDMS